MKLLTRYNRINLFSTVAIFLLASAAFALLLRFLVINQVDEDLRIEQNEITSYIQKYNKLPEVIKVRDQQTEYIQLKKTPENFDDYFQTSKSYNHHYDEEELLRQLNFNVNVGGKWYHAKVSKSLEGTDDLIQSVVIITVITILLILVATFVINRIVLFRLWQPFYSSLNAVSNFKLGKKRSLCRNKKLSPLHCN